MTDLQSRIAALSPEQREQLERRLADLSTTPAPEDRIRPRDRDRPTPLTFAQQREWATGRLRAANNINGAFRLEGRLDVPLLGRVLTEIVERHEALRSTVELRDRTPVQVVHPAAPVPIPVVDLTGQPPEQQRAEVRRLGEAESVRPFDPAEPQRLRTMLLRLADDTHVAFLTTDHAASDAWSLAILVQEFVTLYGIHQGGGGSLPALTVQFGDYAAWQQERFGEERVAAELRYWREALAGIPPRVTLPTDRPHPARPTFAGAEVHSSLPADVTADLQRFTERENASLFTVLLAAVSVLLYRYVEQDDLVVGSAVSGRTRVETERLVGCFSNLLPLRMRLADDLTLRQVVHQARDVTATGYGHQDMPFERLVEELGLGRESSQTPLVQVMVNVVSAPDSALEVPGLRITPEPMDLTLVSIDLSLLALPRSNGVDLRWHYGTELFDPETVALLADQFRTVLHQVVAAPDRTVGDVALATSPTAPAAVGRQARAADAARADTALADTEPGVVELIRRRAALAPHAPAVVHAGTATSYAELDRAAGRLARQLRARGVGPDTRVGVLVDRSPRLAAALLGVLQAGGSYLPLDPSYPPERLAVMLGDAAARVLVADGELAHLVPGTGFDVVAAPALGGDPGDPDGEAATGGDAGPLPPPDPRSLAYVVFTSGSTGRPKGAMIEHGSLATFAREVADRLGLGAGDRFLQFASPSFDVLAEELFPTWVAGGAVVVPTERLLGGGGDLAELVEQERVTVMELPTAYWHEWVRELDRTGRDLPSCLRLVIVGGERVLPERIALWRRLGVPLAHVYGLTETTVSSTFFRLDPVEQDRPWPNLPIGTPLPSTRLRILDSRLRPVPVGGTGELHVGGVGLARGYVGSPGLTADRFVADPDPAHPGERLYRTGDLVRQRPDGALEFVSRADSQIKIRGFRVEPAEVESTLARHPGVAQSVVVARDAGPGDRRLVAYVVPVPGASPAPGELRRHVERELPPHLVPSAFVGLDALPLTTNGKVDHDALPEPDADRPALAEEYVEPRSPVQQQLAEIVASVVGLADAGIHDNFFELGGDSILAIQVVARAHDAGIRLSPLDLFEHPTVARLAEVATAAPVVDAEQGVVTGPVPLVGLQRELSEAGTPDPRSWHHAVRLELSQPCEPTLLREAVAHLLVHHDGLRQRVQLQGEQTRVRIVPPGGDPPVDVVDLPDADEEEADRRLADAVARLAAGLDLALGPVLRVALVRRGATGRDLLAVVAHRTVADLVSLRILLEDLQAAYLQLARGDGVALPPKTTSWQSWARRLAAHGRTRPVQSQRPFWSDLVSRPAGRLPTDAGGVPLPDAAGEGHDVVVRMTPEETDDLLRAAPAAFDCRTDDLLLAALGRVLGAWGGATRYVVDLTRHTRERLVDDVDLTRTVGWLDTVHPLALDHDPAATPEASLRATRDALRAVPAGGTGWLLLRHDVDPLPPSPAELAFDYVGQLTDLAADSGGFAVASGPVEATPTPVPHPPHLLDVRAAVAGGHLTVRWRYREDRHRRETVARLAARHLDELRALRAGAARPPEPGRATSDFPLAQVDQSQLDGLLDRIAAGRDAP